LGTGAQASEHRGVSPAHGPDSDPHIDDIPVLIGDQPQSAAGYSRCPVPVAV
jgi:hypothetical protein